MKRAFVVAALLQAWSAFGQVAPPENLVLDGIPPIPAEVKDKTSAYLEFRSATFSGWHPEKRELLIITRFADTPQLHRVLMPGGAREQITFSAEPIGGAHYQPKHGNNIVFSQDTGGGEFYQLFRQDKAGTQLLTDGKSRNTGARWSRDGKWLAFTSTKRNGADNDLYVINPSDPSTTRLLMEVKGGGWGIEDWSHDGAQLLVSEYISINKSHLHLLDVRSGKAKRITADQGEQVSYGPSCFSQNDRSLYVTTDKGSEFMQLHEFRIPGEGETLSEPVRTLSGELAWDVESVSLSHDGKHLAFVANENGFGRLHIVRTSNRQEVRLPRLPEGSIYNIEWHERREELAFNLVSSKTPNDVFSLDLDSGQVQRWTRSESGGLNTEAFSEPELIETRSFDGLRITAFVYRPDPRKFPGKRPVLVSIHGGPEAQFRPGYLGRNNYLIEELGIALVYPNVRGSSGYGKTFVTLDNGFKREDSVKDIGAILDWVEKDSGLDASKIGVIGGSYGGYMVLASMQHFGERFRCGIDIVGISNFLTFLNNTQPYRRDLRRVEYGDERDPAMREFLERISPTARVKRISKPLLVVQGKNDPRVPVTESEQMVKAIRENGGEVWYLMAKDEGHGFGKKRNADFQFFTTIEFLRKHLL